MQRYYYLGGKISCYLHPIIILKSLKPAIPLSVVVHINYLQAPLTESNIQISIKTNQNLHLVPENMVNLGAQESDGNALSTLLKLVSIEKLKDLIPKEDTEESIHSNVAISKETVASSDGLDQ